MNTFFIEFRDPLFGIIVFFVLIFVITFVSYWWGRFKNNGDTKDLDKFLKGFRSLPSQDELKVLISSNELSEKSWLLLASSYYKNGDYEKSIEIYHELLRVSKYENSKETFFLLGKTYFKAGFLERSKQIFLEILKKNPRTPQALQYLLLVYEYLRDYKSAMEVLEPLDELKKEIESDSVYLKSLALLYDSKLSLEEKSERLLQIYNEGHRLPYMVFEYLFRVDPKLAWKHFDTSKSELLVEVLWNLNKKDLDFDIISKNAYLRELYTARGDIDLAKNSSVFEFDTLIKLNDNTNATLGFEYICDNCKQVFPFVFNRCTSCHIIDTARPEISLVKNYRRDFAEENNSFQ
jgi:lipopolysaccharide assembly protein B